MLFASAKTSITLTAISIFLPSNVPLTIERVIEFYIF